MEVKVNAQNWAELDFLINNFYEIVEYKRGRGIYGDRVILKRCKKPECIFGDRDKFYEFYYLNANAVKELPRTLFEKIKLVERIVISPENMNLLCDFSNASVQSPVDWAMGTALALSNANTLDFNKLNEILINRYRALGDDFIEILNSHRQTQYFLASSKGLNLIPSQYADEQMNRLATKQRSSNLNDAALSN